MGGPLILAQLRIHPIIQHVEKYAHRNIFVMGIPTRPDSKMYRLAVLVHILLLIHVRTPRCYNFSAQSIPPFSALNMTRHEDGLSHKAEMKWFYADFNLFRKRMFQLD